MSGELRACRKSAGRVRPEPPDGVRGEFQRDRDRVIHAKAFRRLMHKTQVFISPDGDHFRTRLTHTLEMMQISRTIARALGLNEDLTEAISLGHDLGHTPFGHTGEEALNRKLQKHGRTFQHNEHSLRVVDVLEKLESAPPLSSFSSRADSSFKDGAGLNLTREVRDGILNHRGDTHPSTWEAEIVRTADRIAYVNHDIDDAIRAGIISEESLPEHPISILGERTSARIDTLVRDMISTSEKRCEITLSEKKLGALLELRSWLFENVYHNPLSREDSTAEDIISDLFDHYLARPEKQTGRDPVTATVDFLAGMTDRYAISTHKRIAYGGKQ